jgi:hypothetical protein
MAFAVNFVIATVSAGLLQAGAQPAAAEQPALPRADRPPQPDSGPSASFCESSARDWAYIPVDSWVYPAMLRLYSLGFVDTIYLGMRPWTRSSVVHMLEEAEARIEDADPSPALGEAQDLFKALRQELDRDSGVPCVLYRGEARVESIYTVARAISGTPLRDSFHLGQSIVNDYGRPYANGFNSYSGIGGHAVAGRLVLYLRGEFQRAPSADGYSTALAQALSAVDAISFIDPVTGLPYNQATIPLGPVPDATDGRVVEAYLSAHLINHEISFGKQDDWLGPGQGGAFAYSNNAEDIYSFRINRVEPLHIPFLSRFTGPFRYDFLVGSLKGHVVPNDPWVHVEKISFRPTENLEFGFERTVIWGGKGHEPITLHTFLRSFFSATNVSEAVKHSSADPGARFGAFDFSYRLPFLRRWLTLYTDSEVHDDVSPIDTPQHAAIRPGLFLSHVPGIPRLDLRVEAASTDPPTSRSNGGAFNYHETIQLQGYTNKGQIFGDWIGREAKGGQGWMTYHLSGNEWLQLGVRNQKTPKDFIAGGTTLNEIDFQAVKRLGRNFEVNGSFTWQRWKAPIYLPGPHTVTASTIRLTWFPDRKISF